MAASARAKKRHQRTTANLKKLLDGLICRIFRYDRPICDPPVKPFMVLVNHNMDFDPILVQLSFPHMYFIASEHVFRKGLWSRLLVYFFDPISRMKGSTDAQAAMGAIRRIRSGDSVCLFPEGNRTFNGVSMPIFPATGKLVKASGAMLVTFRFSGGYMTSPRWGKDQLRRGRVSGQVMGMYSPEELKGMDAGQVNELIQRDLYQDDYQMQKLSPAAYKAKDPAEYLQAALYTCPKCGAYQTMDSKGDQFFCTKCGLRVTVDEFGFFDKDAPFDNVRDWDAWQTEQAASLSRGDPDEIVFSDPFAKLHSVDKRHQTLAIERGPITMTRRAITVGARRFQIDDISGMGIFGKATLMFTEGDKHYEIKFPKGGCGRKYLTLYQNIKEQR